MAIQPTPGSPLDSDRIVGPTGDVPFKHRTLAQQPERFRGGPVEPGSSGVLK
ncbi:hypothetical protein AB0G15_42845 [Streptosporangium sp. NPDC023825]|uniref:hypothetical protein n=1 Tax=Streptosporangium sp. NPDC023825 TaxID=3154909 RepID=UPI003423E195